VVWNDAALRLDDISDEMVLGPALWRWLHEHYAPRARIGGMRIWEWRGRDAGGDGEAAGRDAGGDGEAARPDAASQSR
jgi:hypothetical protein